MVHTDQAKFILLSDLGPLSLPAQPFQPGQPANASSPPSVLITLMLCEFQCTRFTLSFYCFSKHLLARLPVLSILDDYNPETRVI